MANHPGIVWTPVVFLRREDAEWLGYTDVENWRALVNACSQEIAAGYKIAPENLRWYAALHEKERHVHIHMVVFSKDPKEGYLTKEGIRDIKSAFATRIFEQDLLHTYERKTEYRETLQRSAQERMAELVESMNDGSAVSERLEQLVGELAEKLKTTNGKKVYGYLPPRVKNIVDEIVDELAKDPRVAAAYSLWQDMQDEVVRTYTDDLPGRKPLSQQREFKPVRNMVIREALKLSERETSFDGENVEDEPETERYREAKKVLYDENAGVDEKRSAILDDTHDPSVGLAVLRMFRHMANIFRDTTSQDTTHMGLHIDRKRRRELQEKRIAMGHKPDDHEDEKMNVNMR